MALGSIYKKLKTTIDGAANAQTKQAGDAAQGILAAAYIKPWAPAPNVSLQGTYNNLKNKIDGAAQAVTQREEKAALDKLNAPAYQDVSQTYGKAQADAANKTATEATKGQSYEAITSPFASAGAYTKANASRTGDVLQQLYSGNASLKATGGESKLSAGLAAQGGAAYNEEQEKALKDNAQKAYEATNPEAVAAKLLGNMGSIPQGIDLNYQAQSMIAPDVKAAERMDRQARVNEALRTGQTGALAAEGDMALANPEYSKGIRSYITDTSKATIDAAKGTLEADKLAAEGKVTAAKADVEKSNTDTSTIGAVNNMERALGKKLTAAGGSASPEYVAQLREEANKEAIKVESALAREAKKLGIYAAEGPDGRYRYIGPQGSEYSSVIKGVAELNKKLDRRNSLRQMASASQEYSGYMDESLAEQAKAQSELDKIASQYRRFS